MSGNLLAVRSQGEMGCSKQFILTSKILLAERSEGCSQRGRKKVFVV
jgi:hypothetical protein